MKKELIKTPSSSWQEGKAKTVTFIVCEDCQLVCGYCYLVGKNKKSRMSFETARKTVDYLLKKREIFNEGSIIWEFIGGEPFLEIDLIDQISDYIKEQMFLTDHPWFNSYRFSFSTNGLLYHTPSVQDYIEKNKSHLSIGITIDGTKRKHDMHRVYPDGRGSYDDVVKNIPLWLQQFPDSSTKVTVASDDIPLIKESVLHLWDLGITSVNINVVFEDVWKDGDDQLLEEQLTQLADTIIDEDLYRDHTCSFFQENMGNMMDCVTDNNNWCGAGKMLSIDHQGNFYPCTRFAQYSLQNKKPLIVGNVDTGIDLNKLRPFLTLDRVTQSPDKCIECEVGSGCAWCQAANYDFADTDTVYQRAVYICKMHKARVRANNYYWHKLNRKLHRNEEEGIEK
ncbi:MAG: radical SAM peptide maturase, CXXX-repeat target family [Candidatus Omnitrophota bacterium]